ncbi:MAG: AarF/ABC1/UbiB kinase family protein, partial [Calditrichaeota bacterium]|nr:AarF/ABC1/UbiB kinase family protein [Calditrichota bacterium]MCB0315861.1 AarF/ABC1/UbiB kinase family protein [Calditrichota bacterium]
MPDIDHHQPPQSPAARRFRLLRAYRVTLRLLLSLGGFHLLGRLRGAEWVSRRMPDVYRRNARRLKETILVLKGLFIKAGQLISIMSNFLPEDFRRELEELQDRIPPRPLEEMITRIRQEFGKGPEALFAEFETEAIASASLAQVHKARLHDGRVVAVKVQYPDIEAIARIDLATIQRLLRLVGWVLRIRGLDANFAQIREMILAELDFQQEADHIEQIAANFAGNAQVSFPAVIRECSSQRVLTTEFIEGIK